MPDTPPSPPATAGTAIPRAALTLGLLGLLPFVWAALTHALPGLAAAVGDRVPPMWMGTYLALTYGTVILAFMSGVLWGFATRATGPAATAGYVLSVIPALWAFFMVTDGTAVSVIFLAAGFLALLGLDASFARQGLAPAWWMRLRVLLTGVVLCCLGTLLLI